MTDLSPAGTDLLHDVLDAIEQREARLLVWGLVDGRLSPDEVRLLIEPLLERAIEGGVMDFLDAAAVTAALEERALLFSTDDLPFAGYRSRMAETARLLFRLRQMFPAPPRRARPMDSGAYARVGFPLPLAKTALSATRPGRSGGIGRD